MSTNKSSIVKRLLTVVETEAVSGGMQIPNSDPYRQYCQHSNHNGSYDQKCPAPPTTSLLQ